MSHRFACPSACLCLGDLLHRSRRHTVLAMVLAVALHVAAVGVNPFGRTTEGVKRPLTTRFVKRTPRLTKPLEMRKVPHPKRELIPRRAQLPPARMDRVRSTAAFHTGGIVDLLARPSTPSTAQALPRFGLDPAPPSGRVTSARTPDNTFDLSLEMLDVEDMDTGRYQALVIQDRRDRQAVKGFAKIARVFAESNQNEPWHQVATLIELVEALNQYTGIRAQFEGHVAFDEARLLEIPILIYWGSKYLTQNEQANIARYLMSGGFLVGRTDWKEALEKYGSLTEGEDFHVGRLPDDHLIYHSYFDIVGMPTTGGSATSTLTNYIDGLWVNGRLAAVDRVPLFLMGIGNMVGYDATRLLQLGVNLLVYSLTQEGGLAMQTMKMVE